MEELVKIENGEITVAEEIVNQIIEFNKAKKEIEYQEKLLKEGLMNAMNEVGIKKFIINGLSATIKDGTTRTTIDSKRLKAECPEIYQAYSKTSDVKSSITLTVSE
jgi:predicted phage-related endonuclease